MPQEFVAERPNRAPTHPGAILRDDVLPVISLNITQLANTLRVSRQQLHRVLSEESDISTEMALRLGKLCGNGPQLWLRMQETFNLWNARAKIGSELENIPTLNLDRDHSPA